MFVYLDNASTTPITQPVLEAMLPYLTTQYGNPSTLYNFGREARKLSWDDTLSDEDVEYVINSIQKNVKKVRGY